MIKIDFSNLPNLFSPKYRGALFSDHRYILCFGGAGSGKSYFLAYKLLYDILRTPNIRVIVARKVTRTCRESTFHLLKQIIHDNAWTDLFEILSFNMTIRCKLNGSTILHFGLDDVEKLKSVASISRVWIEEATEITEGDFRQIDLRLRGRSPIHHQITMSFNPVSAFHWIKGKFFDVIDKDALVIKTTYKDNFYLDEKYKQTLESLKEKSYNLWRIYTEGEWGVCEGLIYDQPEVIAEPPPNPEDTFYGVDFGYLNPTALVKIEVKDDIYYVSELLYEKKLTNQNLVKKMLQLVGTKEIVYADAAEPNRIEEMKRAGLWVKPAVQNKDVIAGISAVKMTKIKIIEGSNNLINEFASYSWDTSSNLSIEKPVKFNDHLLDALRYAIHSYKYGRAKSPKVITRQMIGV